MIALKLENGFDTFEKVIVNNYFFQKQPVPLTQVSHILISHLRYTYIQIYKFGIFFGKLFWEFFRT